MPGPSTDSKTGSTEITHHASLDSNNLAPVVSPSQPFDVHGVAQDGEAPVYRVYKRRFFGLLQLTLLNVIVSWDWLTFAPVSTSSAQFFGVSINAINWLSTLFLFSFAISTPAVIWTLNRGGPKPSMVAASVLLLVGNWIRYAGVRTNGGRFGLVIFGQILTGLAQPFVLSAPTRYSDMWFTDKGRVVATAIPSLANPLGGALGQLIDPFWTSRASDVPNMVLYVSIISSIACIPSFFIPSRPPTPPTAAAARPKPPIDIQQLRALFRNRSFWFIAPPFVIYVSAFNAISSLLNQILYPYGFSQSQAGITGALFILVGLVTAAITSPILDRTPTRKRIWAFRFLVPVIAGMYVGFIWAPGTRSVAAPYALASILGASSFCLVPLALEFLVEVTYPGVSPEVTSSICWTGGQLGGGIFIVVMDALIGGVAGQPRETLLRGLIFNAVFAVAAAPLPMFLGLFGTGRSARREADGLE